jgi:hypothetical protein
VEAVEVSLLTILLVVALAQLYLVGFIQLRLQLLVQVVLLEAVHHVVAIHLMVGYSPVAEAEVLLQQ